MNTLCNVMGNKKNLPQQVRLRLQLAKQPETMTCHFSHCSSMHITPIYEKDDQLKEEILTSTKSSHRTRHAAIHYDAGFQRCYAMILGVLITAIAKLLPPYSTQSPLSVRSIHLCDPTNKIQTSTVYLLILSPE